MGSLRRRVDSLRASIGFGDSRRDVGDPALALDESRGRLDAAEDVED